MPGDAALSPLSITLAAGLAFTSLCGFAWSAEDPVQATFSSSCQALDERFPLFEESVLVTFDGEGRPVFAWDGQGAQQLIVWDLHEGSQVWNLSFTASGERAGVAEAHNAIGPGVTYGVLPAGLPGELKERPGATPLVAGHVYEVSVLMGCQVTSVEGRAPSHSAAGPTGRFVLPG